MAIRAVSFLIVFFIAALFCVNQARAQSVQCLQTPPVGTEGQGCANWTFVKKSIDGGAPSTSIDAGGGTAITNGANGGVLFDNAGKVAAGGAINNQSLSYTIASSDCFGVVVESGAFKTITLPASLAGFPVNCPIRIINSNASRAQVLSGFPTRPGNTSQFLYPSQDMVVGIVSSAWTILHDPGRWRPPVGTALFVNASGSNSNDCLATGAANACGSINAAIKRWQTDIDCSSSNGATVSLDNGTQSNDLTGVNINYPLSCGTPGAEFTLTGSGSSNVTIQCNGGVDCISVQEPSTVQLNGFTVHTTGNSSTGVFVRQGATADLTDVSFAAFPLGVAIDVTTNAHFNMTGAIGISGSGSIFLRCNFLSYCSFQSHTITISGGLTFDTFIEALNGAIIDSSGGITFSGAGAGTGTSGPSCAAQSNGIIHTGGVTYPGNASTCGAAQTATQGQILNP